MKKLNFLNFFLTVSKVKYIAIAVCCFLANLSANAINITNESDLQTACGTAGTHTLMNNINVSSTTVINITQNIIIEGNNGNTYTITRTNAYRHFNINANNLTVRFQNVILDGNGVGGGITVASNNSFTLDGAYIQNCFVTGNTTTSRGAAIICAGQGKLTVKNSTFSGNSIGTGNSNFGGAIYVARAFEATGCTFAENTARDGGAVYAGGGTSAGYAVDIANCTFYKNTVNNQGGALFVGTNGALVNVVLSTFNGNAATGGTGNGQAINLANNATAGRTFHGNIFYGNAAGTSTAIRNCPAANANMTYNIWNTGITGNNNRNVTTINQADQIFANVANSATGLAVLANNGGTTLTIEIKENGWAHDTIPTGLAWQTGITADQRGIVRPQGTKMDIGAFELLIVPPPPTLCWGETIDVEANVENADTAYAKWITGYEGTGNIPTPVLINNKTELTWSYTAQQGDKDTIKAIVYTAALPGCDPDTVFVEFYTKDCSVPNFAQVLLCYPSTAINMKEYHPTCNTLTVTSVSNPKIGITANAVDSTIVYYHNKITGMDTVTYNFTCNGTTMSGTLYIKVTPCPDNITVVDCWDTITGFQFAIRETFNSKTIGLDSISTYVSPIVGDLDGDGIPEIVVVGYVGPNDIAYRPFRNLYVFSGSNRSKVDTIKTPEGNYMQAGAIGMARVPINGTLTPLIVMIAQDGLLYAYNYNKPSNTISTPQWVSDYPITQGYSRDSIYGSVAFADFNGDGRVQIYVAGRIFDAADGTFITESPGNNGRSQAIGYVPIGNNGQFVWARQYLPTVADIDGDGKLEYIAGTEIYKVDIDNKTMTRIKHIPPINLPQAATPTQISDGHTFLADFNNDGRLDVLVVNTYEATRYGMAIWDIETGKVLGTAIDTTFALFYRGIPFIGDVDGDGELEILMTSALTGSGTTTGSGYLKGYRLDTTNKVIKRVYRMLIDDYSGCTGITLFDFNNDGTPELVYRDERYLRILQADKSIGEFIDVATIDSVTSGTFYEHAVVADVDNDGAAEIITVGGIWDESSSATNNYGKRAVRGSLRIYKSGNRFPWAAARPVWNQYTYNVVNVNKDLTIPQYRMNSATLFQGKDEKYGTSDDLRPYNNFLQQQTLLNQYGVPYWPMPNIVWINRNDTIPNVVVQGDSAVFNGCIQNIGSAALQSPIYFSLYQNDTLSGSFIKTDSLMMMLMAGEIHCFTIVLKDLSQIPQPITSVWISINDKNSAYPYQPQCDVNGRWEFPLTPPAPPEDYAQVLTCLPTTDIDLKQLLGCSSAGPAAITTSTPKIPGASVTATTDSTIIYKHGNVGTDTIQYTITCNGTPMSGTLYIYVAECPDNIDTVECVGIPLPQIWSMAEMKSIDTTYCNYMTPMVGDIDNCGIPEILVGDSIVDGQVGNIYRPIYKIAIFKGNDITKPWKTIKTKEPYSWDRVTKFGIVKTQIIPGQDTTLIVVAEGDHILRAYNYNNDLIWESDQPYYTLNDGGRQITAPGFADFNHDGIPEIMAKGAIFDSRDGHLLCKADPEPEFINYVPIAADLFNTGNLNFIVGNRIYTVSDDLSTLHLEREITLAVNPADPDYPGSAVTFDFYGRTALPAVHNEARVVSAVDINLDGKLELIYSVSNTGLPDPYVGEALIAVVDPETGNTIASKYIPYAPLCSWPLVGDIDGCGAPEIVFITSGKNTREPSEISIEGAYWRMYALKYVSGDDILDTLWTSYHHDPSAETGMTLFDFNLDGVAEIVYRDEQQLRIIDGSLKSKPYPYDLTARLNTSGTGREYPIVADVDADGQAEIVIVGARIISDIRVGALCVYKSADPSRSPWAPARNVWNQYAYQPLHINNNLTMPKYSMNPATLFAGYDKKLGTNDDVRPYNNFFQQQTIIDQYGVPYIPLSDVIWHTEMEATHYHNGDSIVFTGCIKNVGLATLHTPIYFTFYKNDTTYANIYVNMIAIDSIQTSLAVGDTLCFSFTLKNISQHDPITSIWISVNDKGTGAYPYPYQPQCNIDGRREFPIQFPSCPEFIVPTMKVKMRIKN